MVVVATDRVVVAVTLRVVKVGVLVKVIWVEVPISTCCPPVMDKLEEETVKLPKVVVPMPPLETARGLVKVMEVKEGVEETAIVEVPVIAMLEPAVKREEISE